MRIVLVVNAFPKLSETFVVAHLVGLLERGWDAHVLCDRSDAEAWAPFPKLSAIPDVHRRVHVRWPRAPRRRGALRWLPALVFTGCRRPIGLLRYFCRGIKEYGFGVFRRFYHDQELIRLQPDLVHFEFGALAQTRIRVKRLVGCRATVSFRGFDLNLAGLEQPGFYDAVWCHADRIHYLGQALRRRALQRGCPEDAAYDAIPPAVDPAKFTPQAAGARTDGPLRMLSVGRLTWEKGYEYALHAVRALLDRGIACEYALVGDGDYVDALGFLRYRLGLEEHVQFLGSVRPEDVPAHLAQADVFLHPAVSEGFGNAVLEAQAMGVPVACSDAGGLPENVADGETGFVVPRRDVESLVECLARLADDVALRGMLGAAGRKRVEAEFALTQQVEAFDRFFRAALEGAS